VSFRTGFKLVIAIVAINGPFCGHSFNDAFPKELVGTQGEIKGSGLFHQGLELHRRLQKVPVNPADCSIASNTSKTQRGGFDNAKRLGGRLMLHSIFCWTAGKILGKIQTTSRRKLAVFDGIPACRRR
jgi:hypothetical protein